MATFDSYHNEYITIQNSVNVKLDQELPKLRGGEFHLNLISNLDLVLTDAFESLQRNVNLVSGEHTGI